MQKIGFSPSIFFICFNETPLKIMKNAFYFILKALFVLKVFKFLSWLFGHESLVTGRWSLVKIRLISKFMKLQPSYQTITIYTLPNISRSESNKTIKFDQLVDYSKKNIFVQKSCRKWDTGTSSRPL